MKKETLAKLNYVLDSMQLSKEHKAALTDVFNDISSSGGGVDKFVLTADINDDSNSAFININNKYTTTFPNTSAGDIANIYIPKDIFNYISAHLADYTTYEVADFGFATQVFGAVDYSTGAIYYSIMVIENGEVFFIPSICFIPE